METIVVNCLYKEYRRNYYQIYEQQRALEEAQEKVAQATENIAQCRRNMELLTSHAKEYGLDLEAMRNEQHPPIVPQPVVT